MKKKIAVICALLVGFSAMNVHATEIIGEGSASSTVTLHVDSQFTILIPETITADSTRYSLSASEMMLSDNEFVNVTVGGLTDDEVVLTSASGNTVRADIMRDSDNTAIMNGDTIASFANGQTESDAFYLVHGDAMPGDYTGTITFNVSLSSF